MKMKNGSIIFLLLFFSLSALAQHKKYVAPSDKKVQQKLDEWQDLKFGLLMHWGSYSQWGIVESWSICPEDEGWTQRKGPYSKNYNEYVKAYEALKNTFNPTAFDPAKWAAAAQYAGMKYVVFTTKHHDGFCMFDTKQTDYKINRNVAKEIFEAFRNKGFWTGAYFSKPDWHNENYWWPYFPPKDRNVNYEPSKYPQRWQAFKDFTYNQIKELMSEYGKMDILWLDGGWVRPLSTIDTSVEWQRGIKSDQDIDMKRIADMARSYQPGLLIVDRTITGEYENYTTPEQEVPVEPLPYPWETCMTMAGSWSYVPDDKYKSAKQLVHLLIKVVSRGGNYLLNIGPSPTGEWDTAAYDRLQKIGAWMSVNSSAIYNSRPFAPYSSGNIYYTQSKDKKNIYAFYLSDNDEVALPAELILENVSLPKGSTISLLGVNGKLKWRAEGNKTIIDCRKLAPKTKYAAVFEIISSSRTSAP